MVQPSRGRRPRGLGDRPRDRQADRGRADLPRPDPGHGRARVALHRDRPLSAGPPAAARILDGVMASPRTYELRTYGCQMNVHDSERLAGLLEEAGYVRVGDAAAPPTWSCSTPARSARTPTTGSTATSATCTRPRRRNPGMQIAVGGCLAQKDRGRDRRAGAVGRRRVRHAQPGRAAGAARAGPAQPRGAGRDRRGAAELPVRPADAAASRPTAPGCPISVGCDNTCTFCIVPSPARHRDRPAPRRRARRDPGAGRRRRRRGDAARPERQLLRPLVRRPVRVRQAAARVRRDRRAGAGPVHQPASARLHRRRDRGDGRDAATSCRSCTCRCSPARTRCCKAMRRSYRQERYLAIIDEVRAAMPDAAITTDIIVGFPGETDEPTSSRPCDVVRAARFASAFTFQYSKRPGTPAADDAPTRCRRRSSRSATSGCRAAGRDLLGRSARPSSATRSRCWSAPARAARTTPPGGCPAGPATAGWCTSRGTAGAGRLVTTGSPTPRRTTWSPTPASGPTGAGAVRPAAPEPHARAGPSAPDDRSAPGGPLTTSRTRYDAA